MRIELKKYIPKTLAGKISLSIFIICALMILILGLASYSMTRLHQKQALAIISAKEFEFAASRVATPIEIIHQRMVEAAGSSIVMTALVDSADRDAYLWPYLRSFAQVYATPVSVLFIDYEGNELAQSIQSSFTEQDFYWSKLHLKDNQAFSEIIEGSKGKEIIALEPVYYSRTKRREGGFVYKINLKDLHPGEGFSVVVGETNDLEAVRQIKLNAPFDNLKLGLRKTTSSTAFDTTSWMVLLFYLVLVGLSLIVAIVMSQKISRHLTSSLIKLVQFTKEVIAEDNKTQHFSISDTTEISEVAHGLNLMIEKVSELQRKQAEDEVNKVEKRFWTIFEEAPMGIALINADSGRIEDVNTQFSQITDILAEKINSPLGISLFSLVHFEDLPQFERSIKELAAKKTGAVSLTLRLVKSFKSLLWVEMSMTEIETDGSGARFLCMIKDISDKRNAENLVNFQRERLAASAKLSALGEMAGGVAHEINNPLAIVQGKIRILLNRLERPEYQVDREHLLIELQTIWKTTDRITKIVRSMRTFSRDTSNDGMVELSVSEIINDTLELCSERFKAHSIELRTNTKIALSVYCQPTQISQVLFNILGNAYDAVLGRPDAWVELSSEVTDNLVRLIVTDSGMGIPRDVAEKMMQPFFTTKDPGKGTGLGLSISHGIMAANKGNLFYDFTSKHTRFVIEIPRFKPEQALNHRNI